jgi:hypothetical protein
MPRYYFDTSRFAITSGRGYNPAIDTFLKLRRAEAIGQVSGGQLSVVSGPLSGCPLPDGEAVAAAITETNAMHEPALASDVDNSWALVYPPNESSSDRSENVTNEPSAAEPEIDVSWALAIDANKLHGIDARDTNEPATAKGVHGQRSRAGPLKLDARTPQFFVADCR